MKKYFFALTLFCVGNLAHAFPIAFEVNYENNAWGYQNHGCMVDESRFVYRYDLRSDQPMESIGRITREEYEKGTELLQKASSGTFTTQHAAADAGIKQWTGFLYDKHIKLRQEGDFTGTNSAPEAAQLADMIDQWCKE
jgi:hypothetical protein